MFEPPPETAAAEPLVRVMALHALAYCERLFYLEEVEEIRVASDAVYAGRVLHQELEERLARFKHTEASLTLQSGYATNLGVISALMQENDLIISDELNHAGGGLERFILVDAYDQNNDGSLSSAELAAAVQSLADQLGTEAAAKNPPRQQFSQLLQAEDVLRSDVSDTANDQVKAKARAEEEKVISQLSVPDPIDLKSDKWEPKAVPDPIDLN